MIVRGAGAIGATGAAGMAQAFLEAPDDDSFQEYIDAAAHTLRNTRPTAQNLFYGIQKVLQAAQGASSRAQARQKAVLAAQGVADEDAAACQKLVLWSRGHFIRYEDLHTAMQDGLLSSTGEVQSLQSILHTVQGKIFVFVDETRPRGQGARLTAWELAQEVFLML